MLKLKTPSSGSQPERVIVRGLSSSVATEWDSAMASTNSHGGWLISTVALAVDTPLSKVKSKLSRLLGSGSFGV